MYQARKVSGHVFVCKGYPCCHLIGFWCLILYLFWHCCTCSDIVVCFVFHFIFSDDGMAHNNGMKFSAIDVDNDLWSGVHCAAQKKLGGWWYKHCTQSNPNGLYGHVNSKKGIYWLASPPYEPMKTTSMMIKRYPWEFFSN